MIQSARVNSTTRSKLARACGKLVQRPLCEAVEPRLLFTTFAVTTVSDAAGHTGTSLRDAITSANANVGADTITFNIGAGARVISLVSALPAITDTVIIDASVPPTVPPATPQVIELNGAAISAASGASGLTFNAANSGVQGLRITSFRQTSAGVGGNGVVVNASGVGVVSNFIGVGADNLPHGNGGIGVLVSGGSDTSINNNTIAYSGDDGIQVTNAASKGVESSVNSVYSNGGQGIDLGTDGVTANDNLDPDTGPNDLQNFPVITSVTISAGVATVSGTVNSTANTLVYLDFYAGSVAAREGKISLTERDGSSNPVATTVTTNASGVGTFTNLVLSPRDGSTLSSPSTTYITATATSSTLNGAAFRLSTSEFSAPLGIAAAPRVQQVYVSGTAWSNDFRTFLQNSNLGSKQLGYALVGGANQLKSVPWTNANTVSIQFTENVDVQLADMVLRGTNVGTYAFRSTTPFTYDANTCTATWVLAANMPLTASNFFADKLLIILDGDNATGDGNDGVRDAAVTGNLLDGEFTTSSSIYPSGNGAAGGDFLFRFNVVQTDVNRDGGVSGQDSSQIRARQGSTTSVNSATYTIFHDVNADGGINGSDASSTVARQGTVLPANEPTVPPGGLSSPAPKQFSSFSKSFLRSGNDSILA